MFNQENCQVCDGILNSFPYRYKYKNDSGKRDNEKTKRTSKSGLITELSPRENHRLVTVKHDTGDIK